MEPQLLEDYDNLFVNEYIDNMMEMIKVEDNNSLDAYIKSLLNKNEFVSACLEIKKFINKYFFNDTTYGDNLWYEKLFSFEKFIIIAMKLEAYNLLLNKMSKCFQQEINDIPISYMRFAALISRARNRWDEIKTKQQYYHQNRYEIGKKYGDIYLNTRL